MKFNRFAKMINLIVFLKVLKLITISKLDFQFEIPYLLDLSVIFDKDFKISQDQ